MCFSFVSTASQSIVSAAPQTGMGRVKLPSKVSDELIKGFLITCGVVLLAFIIYIIYKLYTKDSEVLAGSECKNAYASLQSDSDIFDYCFGDKLRNEPEYSDVNKDIIGFGEIVNEKLLSIKASIKIQLTGEQCLKYFKKVVVNAKKVKDDEQIDREMYRQK